MQQLLELGEVTACIAACNACAEVCPSCADICTTTARELSRHAGQDLGVARAFVEACATSCRLCSADSRKHADLSRATACHRCDEACRRVLESMAS